MADEAAIVVLANDDETAIAYGKTRRTSQWCKIIPLTRYAQHYDLYGHAGLPFYVAPGTVVQDWHITHLQRHIDYGRIVPQQKLKQRPVHNG